MACEVLLTFTKVLYRVCLASTSLTRPLYALCKSVDRCLRGCSVSPFSCPGLRLFVATICLALFPIAAAAQATGSLGGYMELTSVFFGEGDRTFGPNQVITVSGAVPYIPTCPGIYISNKGRGEGRFDLFPVADLYVVKNTGNLHVPGEELKDVNGTPNRVTGVSGGAFVEEVVGITKPSGALESGKYDVIMDQCLDGIYDPFIDIVLGEGSGFAFEVVVPEGLPTVDLHPLKQKAKTYEKILNGDNIDVAGSQVEIPGFCGTFKKQVEKAKLKERASPLAGWAAIAIDRCLDLTKHWGGIAADPPDPNFTQFAELGNLQYDFSATTTPFERAMRDVAYTLSEQAAESQALLTSLERFQGAQVAGNDEYMTLQLRQVNKYINLLSGPGGSMLRFYSALEFFDRAIQEDSSAGLPETAELRGFLPEVRRGIGALLPPLSANFRRVPKEGGEDLVPDGLGAWVVVYLGLDPFLRDLGLPSIQDVRALKGLPPIAFQHPVADPGGPYATPPGRALSFDGSKSADPNGDNLTFAWDLNGDGVFDDGAGAHPSFTFAAPGVRLVGLEVRDASGHSNIAYVAVRVGDISSQDIIAMSQRQMLLRVTADGNITQLRPALDFNAHVNALHVDVDGSIWVIENTALRQYDATGALLRTFSLNDVGTRAGFSLLQFRDFVIDGKGDLIISLQENLGPGTRSFLDFPQFSRFESALAGRLKLLRMDQAGTRATLIAELDQNFANTYIGGDGVRVLEDYAGRATGSHSAALAIDHNGNIVVSNINALHYPLQGIATYTVDPVTGILTQVINDTNTNGVGAYPQAELFGAQPGLGGVALGNQGMSGAIHPGVEVDEQGNYIFGWGSCVCSSLRLYRVLMPPQITNTVFPGTIVHNYLYESFPIAPSGPGLPYVIIQDTAIDSAGDYVLAAGDFAGVLGATGIFRASPDGIISRVITAPIPPGGFGPDLDALDVRPEERKVTVRDVPIPAKVHLENFTINQDSCPAGAQLALTVRNSGGSVTSDPIRVFFFDGDPEGDGRLIGAPSVASGFQPGTTALVRFEWPNPTPGVHEVFALTLGSDNLAARSTMLCVPAPASPDAITLSPTTADLAVGSQHTVTATMVDVLGHGVGSADIAFTVTGANSVTGNATTNTSGVASFMYTGASVGPDTISATTLAGSSNSVSASWTGSANRAPTADAGFDQTVEATSAAGAVVSLTGSGTDPDGDVLAAIWTGPFGSLSGFHITPTLALGTHLITLTVSDGGKLSGSDAVQVTVRDTTAPIVTPPAAITIPAADAAGARATNTPALATFLANGSATDLVDAAPLKLIPQVGGGDVSNSTLFALGNTTSVSYRSRDAAGNIGSASSTVTVVLGTPKLYGSVLRQGWLSGQFFVDLQLTNTGNGHARNLQLKQTAVRMLSGSGTPTYVSPVLPAAVGSIDVGATTTVRLLFNVPSTVSRLGITESGTVQNVVGTNYTFSISQTIFP
jgi:hypothetical protein